MKLQSPFYRFPITFDIERLQAEIKQFDSSRWKNHPQDFDGNNVIHFVSVDGKETDDMLGTMLPTENLANCPYIQQIMAQFNTTIGRARLMILAPGAKVPYHTDLHYYWRNRVRIHIPIITQSAVTFFCEEASVHMAEGEAWIFDNWRRHQVINDSDITRIHLVIDTVGSAYFWQQVALAQNFKQLSENTLVNSQFIPYQEKANTTFAIEKAKMDTVMHPSEVQEWCQFLLDELIINNEQDKLKADKLTDIVVNFYQDWRATYLAFENKEQAKPKLYDVISQAIQQINILQNGSPEEEALLVSNMSLAKNVFTLWADVSIKLVPNPIATPENTNKTSTDAISEQQVAKRKLVPKSKVVPSKRLLNAPIFLVSAPRSGSTLLFETLACADSLWTIGGESHGIFEDIPALQPAHRNYDSNRLTATDLTTPILRRLNLSFIQLMQNNQGKPYLGLNEQQRTELTTPYFLEKTPKNALRIDFLKAAYPNARFIYLHRNPRDNISSIIDAWRSGNFRTYPQLPQWTGLPWSLLLTPQWRNHIGKHVEEVAAHQWLSANQHIIDDLAQLDKSDWCEINYDEFLSNPNTEIKNLCAFIGIEFDNSLAARVQEKLPESRYTVSAPSKDKWKKNQTELSRVLPLVTDLAEQLGYDRSITEISDILK